MDDSPRNQLGRVQLDTVALGAAACVLIGWFGLTTFATELAGLKLTFHFYDMWTVLHSPAKLLTGLSSEDGARGFAFGALCLAAALTVLVPYRLNRRTAWLACLAPLALMLLCGGVLYKETSAEMFADSGRYGSLGSELVALANSMADRVSESVARHIHVGAGGYLSFAASIVLAVRGFTNYRRREAIPARE